MNTNQIDWLQLQPDADSYQPLFEQAVALDVKQMLQLQPRLNAGLALFCPKIRRPFDHRFMLIKAEESTTYLSLLSDAIKQYLPDEDKVIGSTYHIYDQKVSISPAKTKQDNFAAISHCLSANWVENEQLFGCVRQSHNEFRLQAGLVHKANGGVLILSIQALLMQPLLWLRLKNMVLSQQYQWFSPDETRPLALSIPPMPLDLRVILVGDRLSLGEFEEFEPEIYQQSLYAEFETELFIESEQDIIQWSAYVKMLAAHYQFPLLDKSITKPLFNAAIRESDDQFMLPLSPDWLKNLLTDAAHLSDDVITYDVLNDALEQKIWRENYLSERIIDELEQGLIHIETQGYVVGQINGLSVIEYPGHPRPFGEPARISCAVYFGDGEISDVDRKAELAGHIHAKGMMIMQAFIASELASDQQLPFSASIVFEQSYNEVDGDSASLAGLCALISSLSLQPINQELAVTGAVDQFGNVQPIGGINEKIESFFHLCQRRGLTKNQGVIIPTANIRHLCLNNDVVEAVKNGEFHIYHINHVSEALPLLTNLPYDGNAKITLLNIIQERIQQTISSDRSRLPWFLRWLS